MKKSQDQQDADQAERKKHRTAGPGDDNPDKRNKKRSKVAEAEADSAIAVDIPLTDADSKPAASEKKKRKRDREGDESQVVDSSSSGKEKKKHKKEGVEAVEATEESDERVPQASTSKKSKKKSKKAKADAPVSAKEAQQAASSSDDKALHKKDRAGEIQGQPPAPLRLKDITPSSSEIDAFLSKHSITLHAPDSSRRITPVLSFDQLDVPSELQSAFKGFKEPTPIQACSWPPALEGRDVVGIAETGSGKTLAFGLPALARLESSPTLSKKGKGTTVSVLVVAPTRELAIQTHDTLSALGEPFGIASVAVFGGVDKGPQVKTLKNANKDGKTTRIVVGTPGRILDLVNEGACDLSQVSYLVLDEADRMLDKGFENDIRAIIEHTKQGAERQTLMFSATWPEGVRRLAASFQRDPVRVTVGSDDLTANSRVEQVVEVFDEERSKDSRLLGHLRALAHKKSGSPDDARILVFALYKKEAARVEVMLRGKGYTVCGLHGDMSQSARMDALQKFKSGTTGLLVATDVAARGLDIPNVAAVINYTFPLTIEDYIHRIGRTGRGGKSGKSITFFTGNEHERSLAGELARVLRESGFEAEGLKKFPMTIKKKTHSVYGNFFRDDIPAPKGPTKITFD